MGHDKSYMESDMGFISIRVDKLMTGLGQSTHSGTGKARCATGGATFGDEAILVSLSFEEAVNTLGASISFWMYGDSY